jgi:D-alanine transaminase
VEDAICYLNGRLGPLAEAKVSVLDRGFIFGDGIYELIPVFSGVAFRLPEHLRRLQRSLAAVVIADPLAQAQWASIVRELIQANRGGDQTIYIQITRGVARREHVLAEDVEPTVFLMSSPLHVPADTTPIEAVTMDDIRWQRCDIKTTSLLANVMSRELAARAGSQEAIFLCDGEVTEGAASNVFVATGGGIKTPPLSSRILPGVTRDLIVELLRRADPCVQEATVSEQELRSADEVWVTSSSRELIPVVRIDDEAVGDGRIGPVFRHVQGIYRDYKTKYKALAG